MLRATKRVLKPGGRLSFLVIAIADGLTDEQTVRAIEAGPEHVEAGDGYPALLSDTGFDTVEVVDVTDGYRTTQEAWISEWDAEAAGLKRLLGVTEFTERQARRRDAMTAVDEGLLGRVLISARRPQT